MEVLGKRVCDKMCFLCRDQGKSTHANGFCVQCNDFLCDTCFENHRKWRLGKGHTFGRENETTPERDTEVLDDFDICFAHVDESIRFYCPTHDIVGCGECMILEHKACSVVYVQEIAKAFKDSQDYFCFTKDIEECEDHLRQLESSIHKNNEHVAEVNGNFVKDIGNFKDEIISCVSSLADKLIQEANTIKIHDIKLMNDLETKIEALSTDITTMHKAADMLIDQPNKLFVSTIQNKLILFRTESQLEDIESRRIIEIYQFEREEQLKCLLQKSGMLGRLKRHRTSSDTTDTKEEVAEKPADIGVQSSEPHPKQITEDDHKVATAMDKDTIQSDVLPKPQNSIDEHKPIKAKGNAKETHSAEAIKSELLVKMQRLCRNIVIDGGYISYAGNGSDVGLYVYNPPKPYKYYIEVEIISTGQRGAIALGAVPDDYPENLQPGAGERSVGFHAGDGKLHDGNGSGKQICPNCSVGDRLGVGVNMRFSNLSIIFTRNRQKIGECNISSMFMNRRPYPAIGLHSSGEKVKVILDVVMPHV